MLHRHRFIITPTLSKRLMRFDWRPSRVSTMTLLMIDIDDRTMPCLLLCDLHLLLLSELILSSMTTMSLRRIDGIGCGSLMALVVHPFLKDWMMYVEWQRRCHRLRSRLMRMRVKLSRVTVVVQWLQLQSLFSLVRPLNRSYMS
jgi:hypothetical protein